MKPRKQRMFDEGERWQGDQCNQASRDCDRQQAWDLDVRNRFCCMCAADPDNSVGREGAVMRTEVKPTQAVLGSGGKARNGW